MDELAKLRAALNIALENTAIMAMAILEQQEEINDIRRELLELTHTVEMVDAGIPREDRWRY